LVSLDLEQQSLRGCKAISGHHFAQSHLLEDINNVDFSKVPVFPMDVPLLSFELLCALLVPLPTVAIDKLSARPSEVPHNLLDIVRIR